MFICQLKEAIERGWTNWAKQVVELHIFRADQQNRLKEGKGFYKLNEESIALVRDNLEVDYQALADHHSEEIVQVFDNYGIAEVEVAHHLHQYEAERKANGKDEIENAFSQSVFYMCLLHVRS